MNDKNKKTVNTEEQNRVVNPGDRNDAVNATPQQPAEEKVKTDKTNDNSPRGDDENPGKADKPGGSEVERPHRIEGDDADKIERRIPNM